MNLLQRSISVILLFVFIVSAGCALIFGREARWQAQGREIQMNRIELQMLQKKGCSYEEYEEALSRLRLYQVTRLEITEYKTEASLEGKEYRYPVAWEEIKEILVTKGQYSFSTNSVLELEIWYNDRWRVRTDSYYLILQEE